MRKCFIAIMLLATGCAAQPYACGIPKFELPSSALVTETFPTGGGGGPVCPSQVPKTFTIPGSGDSSLTVNVEPQWLRLKVNAAGSVRLRGPNLHGGTSVLVSDLADPIFRLTMIDQGGATLDSISIPFSRQECTCFSYDGP